MRTRDCEYMRSDPGWYRAYSTISAYLIRHESGRTDPRHAGLPTNDPAYECMYP
eukprot:COSAG02_NODE_66337_length_255_cov_1.326923_1_plen_53_part_01